MVQETADEQAFMVQTHERLTITQNIRIFLGKIPFSKNRQERRKEVVVNHGGYIRVKCILYEHNKHSDCAYAKTGTCNRQKNKR